MVLLVVLQFESRETLDTTTDSLTLTRKDSMRQGEAALIAHIYTEKASGLERDERDSLSSTL